jgi:hypothetical protein
MLPLGVHVIFAVFLVHRGQHRAALPSNTGTGHSLTGRAGSSCERMGQPAEMTVGLPRLLH